jgi:nitroreductase
MFQPGHVSRARLSAVLEAARWAPSAGNLQPWRFVVALDGEVRRGLSRAAFNQSFVASAPAVVVVAAVPSESARLYRERGVELYCLQDTAAAIQNLLLAATSEGLAACWVGAFDEAGVSRVLNLDPGWRPVAMIPIGYPARRPGRRSRRSLDAVTVWVE